jgi:fatty acid desaturase
MKQVDVKISRRTQLLLTMAATVLLGLELAAFFGLPQVWYLLVNLVLVPGLVVFTFWLHAHLADKSRREGPGQ